MHASSHPVTYTNYSRRLTFCNFLGKDSGAFQYLAKATQSVRSSVVFEVRS